MALNVDVGLFVFRCHYRLLIFEIFHLLFQNIELGFDSILFDIIPNIFKLFFSGFLLLLNSFLISPISCLSSFLVLVILLDDFNRFLDAVKATVRYLFRFCLFNLFLCFFNSFCPNRAFNFSWPASNFVTNSLIILDGRLD